MLNTLSSLNGSSDAFQHASVASTQLALRRPMISIHQLSQVFAHQTVLDSIDLTVMKGTILALLGPSGCGKSTLLKLLAGLLQPSSGEIFLNEKRVASAQHLVPPEQRNLGMVFQDYALWPHMTVFQNVAFPLRMRKVARQEIEERVNQALERVGLAGFAKRKPADLSGGQQQRVALARAIIAEPEILLFDEPLSNLDVALRCALCDEMAQLLRALEITAVYVTHDPAEAHALAHQIAHMQNGKIDSLTTL
ncbi:ABC transporter ATP-binding protein [Providencia alcalifaciens]|uniref:ABC transporter ATP-binding protein n=1 Tax=Providencia alcalifaciens TaxID=126385 RepID=UPI0015EBE563|nr:ABC transporter ATP-binding protein [Providencia alcalifaciens]QLQ97178.1 ABC transporter ATP-binding protein [Providencia alcalifaciens]